MLVHSPPSRLRGKNALRHPFRNLDIIMRYNNLDEAFAKLRVFTPEQAAEATFKAGDKVTVKAGEFILVNTDEKGENNAIAANVEIVRGSEKIERTVTLNTLFGTIRTDIPEGVEENVDVILPYAKAQYASRFVPDFNVAEAIKARKLEKDWTFEVFDFKFLVNQFVDRKQEGIDELLTKKTANGQKWAYGLYRLKAIACSKR